MKKKLALLLAVIMLATALVGCGGSNAPAGTGESSEAKTGHKDSLIIGTDADINNLNLQDQQDQINNIVLKNTHQTLVFFNNGSKGKRDFRPASQRTGSLRMTRMSSCIFATTSTSTTARRRL